MIKATFENPGFVAEHINLYLADGVAGHDIDMSAVGGKEGGTPSLLLRTVGRKTGNVSILPLIYGKFGDEYAIIASKGGSPAHPSWYFNMEAGGPMAVQVYNDKFEASWRVAEGDERQKVWDGMVDIYPPYTDYAAATDRTIPVVLLTPVKTIDRL